MGGWEVQDEDTDRFRAWLLPGAQTFLLGPAWGEVKRRGSRVSFSGAPVPLMAASPSRPNRFPQPLPLNTTTLRIQFRHRTWGDTNLQSLASIP